VLFKLGSFIRSWKRRQVELERGELRYYDTPDPPVQPSLKGSVYLVGYVCGLASDGKIRLSSRDRELLLYVRDDRSLETLEEHQEWVTALTEHIKYANLSGISQSNSSSPRLNLLLSGHVDSSSVGSFRVSVGYLNAASAVAISKVRPLLERESTVSLGMLALSPSRGFVMLCYRQNGQSLRVNVCHHDRLGLVEDRLPATTKAQKHISRAGRKTIVSCLSYQLTCFLVQILWRTTSTPCRCWGQWAATLSPT
jgi:hypothetical protein